MRKTKLWTERDVQLLREHYGKPFGVDTLIGLLKRERPSIWIKAQRLGLAHYMFVLGDDLCVERLKENTTEDKKTGCWNWNGGRHSFGYGKVFIKGQEYNTHRLMYSLAFPDVDITGLNVCHHCDNPPCINPMHLYAGTQSENIQDCVKRGRHKSNFKKR